MRLASLALALVAALLVGPLALAREEAACGALSEVPDALQVAWISPVQERVRASTSIEVVRVADLRRLLQEKGITPIRLLQAMGVVNARGKGRAAGYFSPNWAFVTILPSWNMAFMLDANSAPVH